MHSAPLWLVISGCGAALLLSALVVLLMLRHERQKKAQIEQEVLRWRQNSGGPQPPRPVD